MKGTPPMSSVRRILSATPAMSKYVSSTLLGLARPRDGTMSDARGGRKYGGDAFTES